MKKTCIFQDTERTGNTRDLLGAAARIYGRGRFESHAVLLEGGASEYLCGVFHRIICMAEGLVAAHDSRGIAEILENLWRRHRYDSILIPATSLGKMIAPRLAKRLGTGLIAGVTDVERDGDRIEMIRPAWSGKILERIHRKGPGPLIMTVRPNAFEYRAGGGLQTEVSGYAAPVMSRSGIKYLAMNERSQGCNSEDADIRDYEVLVSGGGGVKERFPALCRLADALGGGVAASRKLVDLGIAPKRIQVGQSGKTVSPKLYMALGIHGSMQHMAGLRQVESIISVNTARHAPICSLSDIVVQGDAGEFMDRLTEKIAAYRSGKEMR